MTYPGPTDQPPATSFQNLGTSSPRSLVSLIGCLLNDVLRLAGCEQSSFQIWSFLKSPREGHAVHLSSVTPDLGGEEANRGCLGDFSPTWATRSSAGEVVAPPGGCSIQDRRPALGCSGAPGWEVGACRQCQTPWGGIID